MSWHEDRITRFFRSYKKEIIVSCLVILILTIYHIFSDKSFIWRDYKPLSEPTLTLRILSAFVFSSFGWILYQLRFYYILYIVIVGIFRNKPLYRDLKKVIWYGLMFIMGFVVAPWIVDLLNSFLSFFYNIFLLIIYVFPPYGLPLIIILTVLISIYINNRSMSNRFSNLKVRWLK